jgi:outer membrane protein
MKNNSFLIWNILLTIAVGFLTGLHFWGGKSSAPENGTTPSEEKGLNIVYVNADSLLTNFDEFRTEEEALAAKEREMDSQLQSRARALEQEFSAAQQKIQQGLMTPNQVAQEEQRLMGKQQKLMEDRDRMTQELMMQTEDLNKRLEERVKTALKELRESGGYDFILSYGPGTGVLMVNDSLDVTELVLEKLNVSEE